MGIRFLCEACGKKLNIKEELAGRKGRCPKCNEKILIPTESALEKTATPDSKMTGSQKANGQAANKEKIETSTSRSKKPKTKVAAHAAAGNTSEPQEASPVATAINDIAAEVVQNQQLPETASSASPEESAPPSPPSVPASQSKHPLDEDPDAKWYVRPATGGQFGPADSVTMKSWLGEGRVGADSLVWCEGWDDWKDASAVFVDELSVAATPTENPSSSDPVGGPTSPADDGQEAPASNAAYRHQSRQRARTMGILLIVGLEIVSIVLAVVLIMVANGGFGNDGGNSDEETSQAPDLPRMVESTVA